MARIYRTVEGTELDLTHLAADEEGFLDRCYRAYRANMDWAELSNLIAGMENPLLRSTGGWVTPEVFGNPLYKALRDLEHRVGIRQGELLPDPGDDLDHDPLTGEHISVATSH
jgi:hypothetical protein